MALPQRVLRNATDPFDQIQRAFDGFVNGYYQGNNGNGNGHSGRAPYPVDVREDADHLYVEAELPGFKKDDVEITLENQTLTIMAERNVETKPEQSDAALLLNERRYTRFLRSFTLPPTVDEQHVDAKLNDGVLTITLNKREETKPRKITVS